MAQALVPIASLVTTRKQKANNNMTLDYKDVELCHDQTVILSGVNFAAEAGDFVFITGKVGSGKSTLLSSIYGELRPTKGSAKVLDTDMLMLKNKNLPQLRKQLGVVFQSFELLTDRSVFKNMEFVLRSTGWKLKADINKRIQEVLDTVGMSNKAENFPHELSGGEQQRVTIARALLNHPKIIVADEPTGNLDIENSIAIVKLLNSIRSQGTTIVMSTHNLQLLTLVDDARIFTCHDKQLSPASKNDTSGI